MLRSSSVVYYFLGTLLACTARLTNTEEVTADTYSKCSVYIGEVTVETSRTANKEFGITWKVTCEGTVVEEGSFEKDEDRREVEVKGTPLVLFKQFDNQDYYALVSIVGYKEEVPFEVVNSNFTSLSILNNYGTPRSVFLVEDSKVTISNTTFAGSRQFDAGALYLQMPYEAEGDSDAKVVILDTKFVGNFGEGDGGGIVIDGFPSLSVVNSVFTGNEPNSIFSIEGSAPLDLYVEGCTFDGLNNAASIIGNGPGNINIQGSDFFGNKEAKGGAVNWRNSGSDDATALSFGGCTFKGNHAPDNGGALSAGINVKLNIGTSVFTVNRAGKGGALDLYKTKEVIISDTEFIDNEAEDGSGGALYGEYVSGNVIFKNVTFRGNKGPKNGGACSIEGGNITVMASNVTGNTATRQHGGALHLKDSTGILVSNTVFEDNTVGRSFSGGAIAAFDPEKIMISDSHFRRNKASQVCAKKTRHFGGGAVYVKTDNPSPVSITGSTFEENTGGKGGAIFAESVSDVDVSGSTFLKNRADIGGAIFASEVINVKIETSTAEECQACNWDGGAIYALGTGKGEFTLEKTTFSNNEAPGDDGGAVQIEKYLSAHILSATFLNDTAAEKGGSLYVKNVGTVEMHKTSVSRSKADIGGAVVISEAKTVKISGMTVSQCHARNESGGLQATIKLPDPTSAFTIEGSEFSDNSVTTDFGLIGSGAMQLENYTSVSMVKTHFRNNGGMIGGASSLFSCETVQMEDCTILDNQASGMGGGLWINGSSSTSFTGCEMSRNTAGGSGGGLCLWNPSSTVQTLREDAAGNQSTDGGVSIEFQECTLQGNKGQEGGGAYLSSSGSFSFLNTTLDGNRAHGDGGHLFLENAASVTFGEDAKLQGGTAEENGGAVFAVNVDNVVLDLCTVTSNHAKEGHGGALCLENVDSVEVSGTPVLDNTAKLDGGGCYIVELASSFSLVNSQVDGNKGESGGAVWIEGVADDSTQKTQLAVLIQLTNLTSNGAVGDGGALHVSSASSVTMLSSSFDKNYGRQGGGIFLRDITKVDVKDVDVTHTKATADGGAIFLRSGENVNATKLLIKSNTAENGGGLVCEGETHGLISFSEFIDNEAKNGSAILAKCSCDLEFLNSTFLSLSNSNPVATAPECAPVTLINCTMGVEPHRDPHPHFIIGLIAALLVMLLVSMVAVFMVMLPALQPMPLLDEENASTPLDPAGTI